MIRKSVYKHMKNTEMKTEEIGIGLVFDIESII